MLKQLAQFVNELDWQLQAQVLLKRETTFALPLLIQELFLPLNQQLLSAMMLSSFP